MSRWNKVSISLTCPFSVALKIDGFSELWSKNILIKPSENTTNQLHTDNENTESRETSTTAHFLELFVSLNLIKFNLKIFFLFLTKCRPTPLKFLSNNEHDEGDKTTEWNIFRSDKKLFFTRDILHMCENGDFKYVGFEGEHEKENLCNRSLKSDEYDQQSEFKQIHLMTRIQWLIWWGIKRHVNIDLTYCGNFNDSGQSSRRNFQQHFRVLNEFLCLVLFLRQLRPSGTLHLQTPDKVSQFTQAHYQICLRF